MNPCQWCKSWLLKNRANHTGQCLNGKSPLTGQLTTADQSCDYWESDMHQMPASLQLGDVGKSALELYEEDVKRRNTLVNSDEKPDMLNIDETRKRLEKFGAGSEPLNG